MTKTSGTLRCNACGAETNAVCECGQGYQYIRAGKAAQLAIEKHPEWSNRQIAKVCGVGHATVDRMRPLTASNEAVDSNEIIQAEKRIGINGKVYKPRVYDVPQPSAKTDAVREAIRSSVEANKRIDTAIVAKKLNVSRATVYRAEQRERERLNPQREKKKNLKEVLVSIEVLKEKFFPLADRLKAESKKHVALISQGDLLMISSEIRRLIGLWEDNDMVVRRVGIHGVPLKHPAKEKGVVS